MEKQPNGAPQTVQEVDCGAVVELNEAVLKHGILFTHPDLPIFKMYMEVNHDSKTIGEYRFELVQPNSAAITDFEIHVKKPAEPKPTIIMPEKKGLIS